MFCYIFSCFLHAAPSAALRLVSGLNSWPALHRVFVGHWSLLIFVLFSWFDYQCFRPHLCKENGCPLFLTSFEMPSGFYKLHKRIWPYSSMCMCTTDVGLGPVHFLVALPTALIQLKIRVSSKVFLACNITDFLLTVLEGMNVFFELVFRARGCQMLQLHLQRL